MFPDTTHMATIVVVEDDPTVAELVRAVLNDVPGWGAVVAYNARSAMALLDHVHADAMVADVNLPGMSGIEMLAQLRQTAGWHEPPVIVMSANVPQERVEQVLGRTGNSGADGHGAWTANLQFLPKPFDIDELIELVGQAIECARRSVRRPARAARSEETQPLDRRSLAAGA